MKNLFVGNINFQTTEDELRELFAPFGQVARIHIAKDRETGRARGFAFVEVANDDQAAAAITALDGKSVGGRNLKVNEARPKADGPQRSGSGSRGTQRNSGNRGGRERSSREDYRDSARQPRDPRW